MDYILIILINMMINYLLVGMGLDGVMKEREGKRETKGVNMIWRYIVLSSLFRLVCIYLYIYLSVCTTYLYMNNPTNPNNPLSLCECVCRERERERERCPIDIYIYIYIYISIPVHLYNHVNNPLNPLYLLISRCKRGGEVIRCTWLSISFGRVVCCVRTSCRVTLVESFRSCIGSSVDSPNKRSGTYMYIYIYILSSLSFSLTHSH